MYFFKLLAVFHLKEFYLSMLQNGSHKEHGAVKGDPEPKEVALGDHQWDAVITYKGWLVTSLPYCKL